jgi:hypothetical protein
MSRSAYVFVAILLTSAVLAAPAPQPFQVGWHKPLDPDGDCKIIREKEALVIEMPGTDHDFDPLRDRVNAPCLFRDIEGDFDMQVRVRTESYPSATSTVKGQPAYIAGGFLLIPPDTFSTTCIRLEYVFARKGEEFESYAGMKTRDNAKGRMDALWDDRFPNWPMKKKAEHAYLRLVRRGEYFRPYISPDGKKWTSLVGPMGFLGLPAKLKVGLAAYSSSTEPSSLQFDQFKLIRGAKKSQ